VGAPFRVIPVLLATPGVATGRLQVAPRVAADPDILVSGRDSQLANTGQQGRVGDSAATRRKV